MNSDIKPIAFFLPQFHPIPENDAWWEKGFTEWINVAKARPLFSGHYQPHLPADLGFYDLRVPEVREAQANLARQYGIHAFCYYHYWFSGRRILERPVEDMLATGRPDFPFCLCWANENWTKRWDGRDKEILLQQDYSLEDDKAHATYLIKVFQDPRYLRVEGKPLFLIYKASKHPHISETVKLWREMAKRAGLPGLYLCNVESSPQEHGAGSKAGFDAAVEFAPDWANLPASNRDNIIWRAMGRLGLPFKKTVRHFVHDYSGLVERMNSKPPVDYYRIPCVTPSWDNCARRKMFGSIFHGSTPEIYERWLRTAIQRERQNPKGKGLVFINAWNEWAEGNHLEPCQKWGSAYLEATRRALAEHRNSDA